MNTEVEAGSTLYYELEVSMAQIINSLQILDLAGVGITFFWGLHSVSKALAIS